MYVFESASRSAVVWLRQQSMSVECDGDGHMQSAGLDNQQIGMWVWSRNLRVPHYSYVGGGVLASSTATWSRE